MLLVPLFERLHRRLFACTAAVPVSMLVQMSLRICQSRCVSLSDRTGWMLISALPPHTVSQTLHETLYE